MKCLFVTSVGQRKNLSHRRSSFSLDSFTYCSHIIKISQRIQVIAGQPLDDEDSRKVFPSFVWLLRDVVLSLPKGVENLKKYFLEKVIIREIEQCNALFESNSGSFISNSGKSYVIRGKSKVNRSKS